MAKKRHGGLGRGLDALIPPARREDSSRKGGGDGKDNSPGTADSGTGQGAPADASAESFSPEGSGPSAEAFSSVGSGASAEGNTVGSSAAPIQSGEGISTQPGQGAPIQPGEAAPGTSGTAAPGSVAADQGEVQMLRLSQVDPNRSQPRKKFEEESLEELADSIRRFGVLQPILVKKTGSRYEIIAGERRWRASRKAGLREIPAIVREYSDQETVELSLIENIQREDLNPIEEAKAFKRLLDEFGLRQEDLAERVSKSRTAITNAIRLLKLDERVQNMVVEEKISMGHARALLAIENDDLQFSTANTVIARKMSVRETESYVKKLTKPRPEKPVEDTLQLDTIYAELEEKLKVALGTKVSIHRKRAGKGSIEIEYYSQDELERLLAMIDSIKMKG